MSADDVAEMLDINKHYVYRCLASGDLRGLKIGGRDKAPWRIRVEDVESWVRTVQRVHAEPEPLVAKAQTPERRQSRDPTTTFVRSDTGYVHRADCIRLRVAGRYERVDEIARVPRDERCKVCKP